MPDVTFRIDGLARGRLRFERRPRRLARHRTLVLLLAAAFALPYLSDARLFAPMAAVNGMDVRGRHVLVLLDTSGSMPNPPVAAEAQMRALVAAGISIDVRSVVQGSAISATSEWSLLPAFLQQTRTHQALDTLYVVSDFEDEEFNDAAGIAAFRNVVRRTRMRVYWATVNNDPTPLYYEIARESGGGVIPPR